MIRLIRFIFTGDWHRHEWEWLRVDVTSTCDKEGIWNHTQWDITRCKHCGKIRRFKA